MVKLLLKRWGKKQKYHEVGDLEKLIQKHFGKEAEQAISVLGELRSQ